MTEAMGPTSRRGILKSAAVMTIMTLLSRILGLVREQVRGYFLGTGTGADAFGLGSTLPNLFRRLLAEGAMTAAFVPVFTGYMKKENRQELVDFLSSFLTLLTFVTTLVCLVGILFAGWFVPAFFPGFGEVEGKLALTVVITQITFPYLLLVTLAALVQAVLNTFGRFAPSAFTPVLLNLSIILCAFAFHDTFADPSYAFAIGFVVGGFLQLAFQIPWFLGTGLRLKLSFAWGHPGVRELIRVFIPGAFAAGIYQINVFVSEMIASSLSEGSIAALGYSIRLQELVLGVFVISITTVILPALSSQFAAGDRKGYGQTVLLALDSLALVTVPAAFGIIAIREPLLRLLFQMGAFDQDSTRLTGLAVLFHSMGVYFIASSRSLNQAFYAMKDLKTPMLVSAAAMVVNVAGCYLLAGPLSHGGIALANSLSAAVTALLLFAVLLRKAPDVPLLPHLGLLLRVVLASGVMYFALDRVTAFLPMAPDAGKLRQLQLVLIYCAAGIVVFLAAGLLLLRKELAQLLRVMRRRGKK
jgi:putative peptidoglycan lipid II flippase